ncbi:hypothetical protein [Streptomyces malaysiensis]|uniref:hypothetical protein n=1 Tax=Streptomyces malaysiensis TaxID=92644 RepID=UPI001FE692C0|nr:hypothetical protein [Streptomyces solisilvae]
MNPSAQGRQRVRGGLFAHRRGRRHGLGQHRRPRTLQRLGEGGSGPQPPRGSGGSPSAALVRTAASRRGSAPPVSRSA